MSEQEDAPKLPPFPLPDGKQTSELMNRLQTFIPQLQAANQALPTENVPRVDVDLQSENEDDDDDDDGKSTSSQEDEDEAVVESTKDNDYDELPEQKPPTIQIQFSIGDMKDNPLMELLAKNKDESEGNNNDSDSEASQDDPKEEAVVKLLSESSPSTEKKKGLITEL